MSVAVRSTPSIDTESPRAVTPAVSGASMTSASPAAPPSADVTTPRSRTIPVNTGPKASPSTHGSCGHGCCSLHPQPPPSQGARVGVGTACHRKAQTSVPILRRISASAVEVQRGTPTSLSLRVVDVGLEQHVVADLLRAEVLQGDRFRERGDDGRTHADELRRDEDE